MTLLEQARDNLGAIAGLMRMSVGTEWCRDRIDAAREADRRLQRYEADRESRLESYLRGEASEIYRRRWRSRGLIVAIQEGGRFTRAIGG